MMKTNPRKWLALLLTATMLYSLAAQAFASDPYAPNSDDTRIHAQIEAGSDTNILRISADRSTWDYWVQLSVNDSSDSGGCTIPCVSFNPYAGSPVRCTYNSDGTVQMQPCSLSELVVQRFWVQAERTITVQMKTQFYSSSTDCLCYVRTCPNDEPTVFSPLILPNVFGSMNAEYFPLWDCSKTYTDSNHNGVIDAGDSGYTDLDTIPCSHNITETLIFRQDQPVLFEVYMWKECQYPVHNSYGEENNANLSLAFTSTPQISEFQLNGNAVLLSPSFPPQERWQPYLRYYPQISEHSACESIPCSLIPISLNPRSGCAFLPVARSNKLYVIPLDEFWKQQYMIDRTVYLKCAQSQVFEFYINSMHIPQELCVYVEIIPQSGGTPDCKKSFLWIPGSDAYYPYPENTLFSIFHDWNSNGRLDPDEVDRYEESWMLSNELHSDTDVNDNQGFLYRLESGTTYQLRIRMWLEAQLRNELFQPSPSISAFSPCLTIFPAGYSSNDLLPYSYTITDEGAVLTGCDPDFLDIMGNEIIQEGRNQFHNYNEFEKKLCIPDCLGGQPVIAIEDYALRDIPPHTILLPSTVQRIGSHVFGSALQTLHLPYGVLPDPDAFDSRDVTLCCGTESRALQAFAASFGFGYAVCSDHGTTHTHAYNVTIVPAGFTLPEKRIYTCTCGETYAEYTAEPLNLPQISTKELRIKPGQTAQTPLHLQSPAPIPDVHIAVQAPPCLRMESVQGATFTPMEDGTGYVIRCSLPADLNILWRAAPDAARGNYTLHWSGTFLSTFAQDAGETLRISESASDAVLPERIAADADSDGSVSLRDAAVLRRFLAEDPGAQADAENADVNADGIVNLKDLTLILRYLAGGWNVTLR